MVETWGILRRSQIPQIPQLGQNQKQNDHHNIAACRYSRRTMMLPIGDGWTCVTQHVVPRSRPSVQGSRHADARPPTRKFWYPQHEPAKGEYTIAFGSARRTCTSGEQPCCSTNANRCGMDKRHSESHASTPLILHRIQKLGASAQLHYPQEYRRSRQTPWCETPWWTASSWCRL